MKKLLISLFTFIILNTSFAQSTDVSGPVDSGVYGSSLTVLSNGNYVVTDSLFGANDIGAVYLYNGITHALISTLKGSTANDYVGNRGVTALPNGNFVVCSSRWINSGVVKAGAVTFVNGTTGLNGTVSPVNSLVGSTLDDEIGRLGIVLITGTNNYLTANPNWNNGAFTDAGAVTWGSGTSGVSGIISASNSLIGNNTNDKVGSLKPVILTNGNYVIGSPNWKNANNAAGAATWGNGTAGTFGLVSTSNSLVGSSTDDNVGFAIFPLTNGNYVVSSPNWNGNYTDSGAATWGNGITGITGVVSIANSLIGGRDVDKVSDGGIIALTNGNYVVRTINWDLSFSITNVGAVTWGNGATGTSGYVSASNSLIGSTSTDQVGSGEVVALTNGNYVSRTNGWDNGAIMNVGAVTFGNGLTGTFGPVTIANSLYGGTANDFVGAGGITILSNGNYVVNSFNWDNVGIVNAGAATWGNGTTGTSGLVSATNSLVGSTTNDNVGTNTALKNGNYLVRTPIWDNTGVVDAGEVTWANGATGITGTISSSNSLVGSSANDVVGTQNTIALENGNYVVSSFNWDNGISTNVGAVTFGNGTTGIVGAISSANSLIGSTISDNIGGQPLTPLTNGNYVIRSANWDNGIITNVGAATLVSGISGITGTINTSNSFTGITASDAVSSSAAIALTNSDYLIRSNVFDNGLIVDAGAITYGFGNLPSQGTISSCNSVFGGIANGGSSMTYAYNYTYNYLLVGRPMENKITIFRPDGQPLAIHNETGSTNIMGTGNANLQVSTGCKIIAKISPLTPNPISGTVNSKVWVETTQPATYVKRHYQIYPTSGAANARAKVTLYFTQQEFLDYNMVAVNDLPTSAGDAQGKANLRINKIGGESTTGTGVPASYQGIASIIDPDNNDIVYNSFLARWEVSFITTGFSGFFAFGEATTALPVTLIDFYGKKVEDGNQLIWQTSNETNFSHFEIERSANGNKFEKIGKVNGNNEANYQFMDRQAPSSGAGGASGGLFYRLRFIDLNGTNNYSKIIYVENKENEQFTIFPNPSSDYFSIKNTNFEQIQIIDISGKLLKTYPKNSANKYSINGFPKGAYFVKIKSGNLFINRKILVE